MIHGSTNFYFLVGMKEAVIYEIEGDITWYSGISFSVDCRQHKR